MTDSELLSDYNGTGSQEAFSQLVSRYVDLVYAAALRQLQDPGAAQDVTQEAFVLLARKAKSLRREVVIAGWLLNTTRYLAHSHKRKEARRRKYEERAVAMKQAEDAARWEEVSPLLDDALADVPETNRLPVVLRYLQGKSSIEVGELLGISEEAARKRVSRGVEQLRQVFRKRGLVFSADGLSSMLVTSATASAPASLAATVALKGATAKGLMAVKPTLGFVAALQAKVAVVTISAVVVAGGVAVGTQLAKQATAVPVATSASVPAPAQANILCGTIRDSSNRPVAGARVRIGSHQKGVSVYAKPSADDAVSDANGNYSMAEPDPPYLVVVTAEQGIAEASSKQLEVITDITLQPWGRIEGILQPGGKPAAKQKVHLWRVQNTDDPNQWMHHETEVTTDAKGHFVIPRVAPGELSLFTYTRRYRSTGWFYTQVEPGKTLQVTMGGDGQSVVGRVEVPPELSSVVTWKEGSGKHSYEARIRPELTRQRAQHAQGETPEEYTHVEEEWGRTPEGKFSKQWMFGEAFSLKPDGTFRIDDLPPGKWTIDIRNFEEDPAVSFMEDVAHAQIEFVVPKERSANAIDLGKIKVAAVPNRMRPGQTGPDFRVKTLDGKEWNLADHKNKPVVLIFWGVWSNLQELPEFAKFWEKWGNDDRISVLGAGIADNEKTLKDYMSRYKLNFPQASFADSTRVMTLYNSSWPEAVLIGKDGRIVQKHLRGETLEKFVEKEAGK